MKEQIYEIARENQDRYLSWWWVKKLDLGISRYLFHKYCGELVDEGRLERRKWSGIVGYQILLF